MVSKNQTKTSVVVDWPIATVGEESFDRLWQRAERKVKKVNLILTKITRHSSSLLPLTPSHLFNYQLRRRSVQLHPATSLEKQAPENKKDNNWRVSEGNPHPNPFDHSWHFGNTHMSSGASCCLFLVRFITDAFKVCRTKYVWTIVKLCCDRLQVKDEL